jgi:hypothetical protein
LPRHRLREVAIGLLDSQAIAHVEHVAAEGERVAVAPLPLASPARLRK